MTEMSLSALIGSDLARYHQTYTLRGQPYSRWRVWLESLFFKGGFQAVLLYRVSHWLHLKGCTYLAWFLTRLNLALTGAEIEFNAQIGPGMFIAHPVGVMIGRGTVMGSGATLFHGVSFGVKGWRPDQIRKFPRVGDHCYFFAHCVVIGDIIIGDGCVVAAQSLLMTDMPSGSLAAGVPARVHPDKGREALFSWGLKSGGAD